MYNYSKRFYDELEKDNRDFLIKMSMVVKDLEGKSVSLNVSNGKIFQGTFKVDSATSGVGQFEVGSLVASSLTFSLYNENEEFSAYDFVDGTISLQVGMVIDGVEEVVNYGKYIIVNAKFSDNEISIEALDTLSKLSQAYVGGIMFPSSLNDVIRSCAYACGVDFDASSVPNWANSYIVEEKDLTNETYANIVSYCAQIIGCYVRADHEGRLALNWYDMTAMQNDIDGGTYDTQTTPYSDGDNLNGGTFAYNDGDDYDGGTFRGLTNYHIINETATADIATDDVTITGIKVTSTPSDGQEEETSTAGSDEYVVLVSNNPFIPNGKTQVVADHLRDAIVGMTFRPLDVSILSNPAIEAGDVATVADYKNNYYKCFLSNVSFQPDNYSNISCDAMSVNRQASASSSVASQVLRKAKEFVANEKSARDIALDTLATLTANSLGFFSTDVVQEGGGIIRYMHNKPRLEDSHTQWKITENGFVVSTDYGRTWNAGIDKNGNAVMNVLSAIGINADWINTGYMSCSRLNGGSINGQVINGGRITSEGNGKTVIEGGRIESNNAIITGGEIKIKSSEESWDYIQLLEKGTGAVMGSSAFRVFDYSGGWDEGFGGYTSESLIESTRIIAPDFYFSGDNFGFYPPPEMVSVKEYFVKGQYDEKTKKAKSVGSSSNPVYVNSSGQVTECGNLYASSAGTARNADYANLIVNSSGQLVNRGNDEVPVYFNNGEPTRCNNLYAQRAGKARDADYANLIVNSSGQLVNRGSSTHPVYFSGGEPIACSGYSGSFSFTEAASGRQGTITVSNGLITSVVVR